MIRSLNLRSLTPLSIVLMLAPALAAQEPVPLVPGQSRADSLAAEEVHRYALELPAGSFVFGEVDQQTVDVVVRVFGPDDRQILSADGPARGAEAFQFDTDTAGTYRVEVAPFRSETGRYAVLIRRVEPVAEEPADRIDQLMTAYSGEAVPGAVVAVIRDGETSFARAYGMANLTHGVPFDPDTPTNIGSVSKQFTAFAIALLAERGRLSLDDDVRDHIPELPAFEEPVTLRHLLTHTSGYREIINALALAGRRFERGDYIAPDEVLALVQRQPELQNAPGAEWNYNNTGYILLSRVVERVTGETFAGWMDRNVFDPLGMDDTTVREDPFQIIPNSAQGYLPAEEGGWADAPDLSGSIGAGGIYTTVDDLAKWAENLETGALGGPALIERMTTRYVLTDGDTTSYGLGLFIDEYRGLRRVHHGGADLAHRAMIRYYPEIDAAVLALSNNASFDPGSLTSEITDAFLAEQLGPEEEDEPGPADARDFDPAEYEPAMFEPLEGRYALQEMPSFVLSFFREGDTLFTQATGQPRLPIVPTSDSTFSLQGVDAHVTFHRTDGAADSLTLHQNGHHVAHRIEGDDWDPEPEELARYTGRFFSLELETFYELVVEDGDLLLRHRRFADVELLPGDERGVFTGTFPVAEIRFIEDQDGDVTALEASNVRTRGVRFERMPPRSETP